MKITLTINMDNMDNEVFDDSGEVSRILREAAERLDNDGVYCGQYLRLRDINWNSVGHVEITR